MIAGYREGFMLDYNVLWCIENWQAWPNWWRAFDTPCKVGSKTIMLRGYKWAKH